MHPALQHRRHTISMEDRMLVWAAKVDTWPTRSTHSNNLKLVTDKKCGKTTALWILGTLRNERVWAFPLGFFQTVISNTKTISVF